MEAKTFLSIPVFALLAATLTVLKLIGTINLSWWWIIALFAVGPLTTFVLFIVIFVLAIIAALFKD